MNRKWINIILLLTLVLITVVVVADYLSTRPGKRPANPFAFDVSEYEEVSADLLSHREVRQISIPGATAKGIAAFNDQIYLLFDDQLRIVTARGEEVTSFAIRQHPGCFTVSPHREIIIAFENHLRSYSQDGEILFESEALPEGASLTSLTCANEYIFAADAGGRQVLVFTHELELTHAFKGESGVSELHGFILPSAHFDLAVNQEGELWAVNPGLHVLQLYGYDGRFRRQWGKPSFANEGFSGCCNPYYIAFYPDGRMVTSEKGMVRIKVYKESGELESVAAPPGAFKNAIRAPAIAVLGNETIAALDFDMHAVRIFEPIEIR